MVKHHEQQLDSVFHALSDQTRRAILLRLARGECNVSELADPFHMSLAAVSKHIKVLEQAGLVRKSKDGRMFRCQASLDPLADANQILEQLADFWQGRLDALDAYFSNSKSSQGDTDGKRSNTSNAEVSRKKAHPRKKRSGV